MLSNTEDFPELCFHFQHNIQKKKIIRDPFFNKFTFLYVKKAHYSLLRIRISNPLRKLHFLSF